MNRRGATDGWTLEAVADFALPDLLGAGELGLIARDLARRVGAESTLLWVQDETSASFEVAAAWGIVSGRDELPLSSADGFLGRVLSCEEAVLEPFDPDQDDSLGVSGPGARISYAAGAALHPPGGPRGVLCAGLSVRPEDPALTLWMVESCARLASLCLLDRGALDGLLAGTQRDALTGCLNYAAIRHEVIREIRRSDRHGLSVSCCFVDLDRFRRVNGRYGHLHGNQVLASVAAALRAEVRSEDTLGRYGGDEFVLLVPDTDEAAAVELAERLRSTITSTLINLPHDPIDASIGVAQWQPGSGPEDMLVAADQALLAAKALGGGAVIRASGLTATTRSGNTDQQNGPSATTGSSEVRFCGYCAHRPTRATNHRVCTKCGLGVLISASADVAPSSEEAFLILDEDMFVGALSEQMQLLIGASENSAIDRHIDNFLILTDAQDPVTEQLERALARAAHGDTTPRLAIQLRTSTGDTITLRARVGPCEPLPATLIVLTDTD